MPTLQEIYDSAKSVESQTGIDPAIITALARTEGPTSSGSPLSLGIQVPAISGRGNSGGILPAAQPGPGQPSAFWSYASGAEAAAAFGAYIKSQFPSAAGSLGNATAFFQAMVNTNYNVVYNNPAVGQASGRNTAAETDYWQKKIIQADQDVQDLGGGVGSTLTNAGQDALNKIIDAGNAALAIIEQNTASAVFPAGFFDALGAQLQGNIDADKAWLQGLVNDQKISQAAADAILTAEQQVLAANPNATPAQIKEFIQGIISDPGSLAQRLQDLGSGPGGVLITTVTPGLGAVGSAAQGAGAGAASIWKAASDPLGALNAISKALSNLSDLGTNVSDEIKKISTGNFQDLSGAAVLIIGMSIIGIGGILLLAEASGNSQVQSVVKQGAKVAAM